MPRSKRIINPPASSYTPTRILSSAHSPLPNSNIHTFLLTCITDWSSAYTESEKKTLISTFPPPYRIYDLDLEGKLLCPLTVQFVEEDAVLKAGIERFKRDVMDGYYDAAWRREAGKAMSERAEGKFDAYLREKVEEEFGEDGDVEGESSEIDKERGKGENEANRWGGKIKGSETAEGKSARGELRRVAMDMDGANDYEDDYENEKTNIMEGAMAP